MRAVIQPVIFALAILHLLIGSVWVGGLALLSKRFGQYAFHYWCRITLRLFGVGLRVYGDVTPGVFLAPNHFSWLDILVLQAITPVTFLSKEEVRGWPVVGSVAARLGTVFIGPKYGGADQAAKALSERLKRGDSVVVFPEGQLNQSERIQPFIPRLFRIAQEADIPVQPVGLTYRSRNPGEGLGDLVPEHSFTRSAAWLAGHGVTAQVFLLPPIAVAGRTRRELGDEAEQAVADALGLARARPRKRAAVGPEVV